MLNRILLLPSFQGVHSETWEHCSSWDRGGEALSSAGLVMEGFEGKIGTVTVRKV